LINFRLGDLDRDRDCFHLGPETFALFSKLELDTLRVFIHAKIAVGIKQGREPRGTERRIGLCSHRLKGATVGPHHATYFFGFGVLVIERYEPFGGFLSVKR